MKRYLLLLYIFIAVFVLITGIWILNNTGIISVRAWGEKVLTNIPYLEEYVKIDEDYDLILDEKEKLIIQVAELKGANQSFLLQAEENKNKIVEQAALIEELKQKIEDLKAEQKTDKNRLDKVIQIYEKMEPKEAANIFATLDQDLALSLLYHLKDEQSASILANLPPEKAAELTKALR